MIIELGCAAPISPLLPVTESNSPQSPVQLHEFAVPPHDEP